MLLKTLFLPVWATARKGMARQMTGHVCPRLWTGHYDSSNPGPEGGTIRQRKRGMPLSNKGGENAGQVPTTDVHGSEVSRGIFIL